MKSMKLQEADTTVSKKAILFACTALLVREENHPSCRRAGKADWHRVDNLRSAQVATRPADSSEICVGLEPSVWLTAWLERMAQ
jgi:hypothetical protein